MSFICGDCHREHLVPTREEDRDGQPCIDALCRERLELIEAVNDLAAQIKSYDPGGCRNAEHWDRLKLARKYLRNTDESRKENPSI